MTAIRESLRALVLEEKRKQLRLLEEIARVKAAVVETVINKKKIDDAVAKEQEVITLKKKDVGKEEEFKWIGKKRKKNEDEEEKTVHEERKREEERRIEEERKRKEREREKEKRERRERKTERQEKERERQEREKQERERQEREKQEREIQEEEKQERERQKIEREKERIEIESENESESEKEDVIPENYYTRIAYMNDNSGTNISFTFRDRRLTFTNRDIGIIKKYMVRVNTIKNADGSYRSEVGANGQFLAWSAGKCYICGATASSELVRIKWQHGYPLKISDEPLWAIKLLLPGEEGKFNPTTAKSRKAAEREGERHGYYLFCHPCGEETTTSSWLDHFEEHIVQELKDAQFNTNDTNQPRKLRVRSRELVPFEEYLKEKVFVKRKKFHEEANMILQKEGIELFQFT